MAKVRSLSIVAISLCLLGSIFAVFALTMEAVSVTYNSFLTTADKDSAYLIIGVDSGGRSSSGGRTDFIAVAYLGVDNSLKVMNIPRDTLVSHEGRTHRINALMNQYGIDALISATDRISGKTVAGYVVLDFETVTRITEVIGPLRIFISSPMHYDDYQQGLHIHFEPGTHYLEGEKLLEYVRFRYDDAGDLGRIRRQREVIELIMSSVLQAGPAKVLDVVEFLMENTEVEFELLPAARFALSFITGIRQVQFMEMPHVIDDDGHIRFVAQTPMPAEIGRLDRPPEIIVLSNIDGYSGTPDSFAELVRNQWLHRTGLRISVFPHKIDVQGIEMRKTYIFINDKYDEVYDYFSRAHPVHVPIIFDLREFEGIPEYLGVIEAMAKRRRYVSYYDAVILLGVGQQ